MTENTIDIVEALTGGDTGLRLFAAEPHGARLQVAITREPFPGDDVLEAQGVRIYVDAEASRRLDGKALDAAVYGRSVRFAVIDRLRPRVRSRRGPRPQLARWAQPGTWLWSSSEQ